MCFSKLIARNYKNEFLVLVEKVPTLSKKNFNWKLSIFHGDGSIQLCGLPMPNFWGPQKASQKLRSLLLLYAQLS